jgi:glycosyltransferase involved in cell wall biosynthesis
MLKSHRGAALVVLPTLKWKYSDTIVHTFLSIMHAVTRKYDMILLCNAANSLFAWIPRIFGIPVVVNVDGIEHRRQKWNWLGKAYYRLGEYFSVWFPNAIVSDAQVIQEYYSNRYRAHSVFIPYGAATEKPRSHEILDRLGVATEEYFLYVSRLEPENNAHLVVEAFEKVRTPKRLIVVGDAPYAKEYIQKVRATRDPRILFPGAIYGEGYRQLQAHACCYIHATEVGGTHPALIEAMGQGNIVIANRTPENVEVLQNAGLLYQKNDVPDLTRCLQEVADHPEKYSALKIAAVQRARADYSWDSVIRQYEELFMKYART